MADPVISDAVLAADTEGFAAYIGTDGREQHRSGIRAAVAEYLAEQARTGAHVYLSTGCLHGRHDYCQSANVGRVGAPIQTWTKQPAACKFCAAPCICRCHEAGDDR